MKKVQINQKISSKHNSALRFRDYRYYCKNWNSQSRSVILLIAAKFSFGFIGFVSTDKHFLQSQRF